jgi:hypothetical protein
MIAYVRRHRSLLPISAALAAFALGVGLPAAAVAADHLKMHPERISCQVTDVGGGAKRCDVAYDGFVVHEGREMSPAVAQGDCAKCGYVVERAIDLGRDVVMLRGYVGSAEADWGMDAFFTVEANPDDDGR